MAAEILIEGAPTFENEPAFTPLFRTLSMEYNISRRARRER
jgi:hypothetical protein